MKNILLLFTLSICISYSYGQSVNKIEGDTIKITKRGVGNTTVNVIGNLNVSGTTNANNVFVNGTIGTIGNQNLNFTTNDSLRFYIDAYGNLRSYQYGGHLQVTDSRTN